MAKGGKFAALAQFRQEQHIDDEAPSVGQPTDPIETPPAEQAAQPIADAVPATIAEPLAASAEPVRVAEVAPVPAEVEDADEIRLPARLPRETVAKAPRPRGRPPGKRSDPDWKLFSHFLKRSTQRQATALLFEQDDGRDLSDVLQNLLEKWVTRERAKI